MSRLADTKDVNQKAEGSGFSLLKRQRSRTSASRLLPSAFLLLPAVLFLAVFFLLPLTRILAFSLDASALTAANFRRAFSVLRFTFYQATLSTLLTFLLASTSAANPSCAR
ncbi:MAG: hypothetical protein KJZ57_04845 [Anaerolineales bacterium]|nr:hypothetical protein [Anaerolineales bacterium]